MRSLTGVRTRSLRWGDVKERLLALGFRGLFGGSLGLGLGGNLRLVVATSGEGREETKLEKAGLFSRGES